MAAVNDSALTVERAREITRPFYDSLNRPAEKDVPALLAEACHDDYHSYHTNSEWLTLQELAGIFTGMGQAIPDLTWDVAELHVVDDKIIVRGRAQGTPTAAFWGAPPTGKSFDTMAIDLFTVRGDKLASCHHIENWMTALEQINAD
jgi:predicted ester cyclase